MTYNKFWSPQLADLAPYTPGEQPREPGLIKLNTNENPYPPSPRARAVLNDRLGESLRLYPDPDSHALKQAVAAASGVAPQQVFVGNGSDEVLALIFMAFFQRPVPLLFPDISYSFYPVYSQLFGIDARPVPLAEDFRIDLDAYRGGNVIFPNPNAPTGIATPLAAIEALLRAVPDQLVVVDEAYVDFGADSAAPLIGQYPNLLVVQTLSKSRSLAGMRVGFALGQEGLIEGLDRVKNSFNSYPIDRVAEAVAVAALEDRAWFDDCCARIAATREATARQLAALGFEILPSSANFLFCRHPHRPGAALFSALRERHILVRHFDKPRIDNFLRITVGTEQQMQALVDALTAILRD